MKAHHFFAIWLSKKPHLEYDADHDGFERRHGRTASDADLTWTEAPCVRGSGVRTS
jgi:hypothetical protein